MSKSWKQKKLMAEKRKARRKIKQKLLRIGAYHDYMPKTAVTEYHPVMIRKTIWQKIKEFLRKILVRK